jgi:hypothetical protein
MAAGWWEEAPELFESAFQQAQRRTRKQSYRFGVGHLELDSDDALLNRRFSTLYPEGASNGSANGSGARVGCSVRSLEDPRVTAVRFLDPEPLDPIEFCEALFPNRDYVPGPPAAAGWRTIALGNAPGRPIVAMNENRALVDRDGAWQALIANVALNRLLRLQRELVFFHAGSVSVCGKGMLFMGPKGSGKTTLSLTLASRGHAFLGDEIAAVRIADRRMFPFRRAASIRSGLRADAVNSRLSENDYPAETFPDGSPRILANVADLFPRAAASEATLASLFFLRRFASRPRIERFEFGREHFAGLTPLGSSLWGIPGGLRMLHLSRLVKDVQCHYLDPGNPDETADLIEAHYKESRI